MQTHALFYRLTRRSRGPSLLVLLIVTAGVWVVTGAVALLHIWSPGPILDLAVLLIQGLGFAGLIASPPITASYAATLTTAEVVRKEYQLVRLSELPKKAIVMDLYYAALYRLRALYCLPLSLIPAMLAVGLYQSAVTGRASLTSSGIIVIGMAIWMALATLLGSALGVLVALRWRKPPGPLVTAPLILLGAMAASALCFVCPFYIGAPFAISRLLGEAEKWA